MVLAAVVSIQIILPYSPLLLILLAFLVVFLLARALARLIPVVGL